MAVVDQKLRAEQMAEQRVQNRRAQRRARGKTRDVGREQPSQRLLSAKSRPGAARKGKGFLVSQEGGRSAATIQRESEGLKRRLKVPRQPRGLLLGVPSLRKPVAVLIDLKSEGGYLNARGVIKSSKLCKIGSHYSNTNVRRPFLELR